MELKEFAEQTAVIAKDQPGYRPLPAHIDSEGKVTCCWKLNWRERLAVLFSGELWHQILTFGQPLQPQLLAVEKPEMTTKPKEQRVKVNPDATGTFGSFE